MRINAKYEYKSAILLDEQTLKEFDSLLKDYLGDPEYKVRLLNEETIDFESIEELIKYDNFSRGAIKALDIRCGYGAYAYIRPEDSMINSYRSTVDIDYRSADRDKSEEFKRKLDELFDKHKQSVFYTLFSKISIMHICFIALIASISASISSSSKSKQYNESFSFIEALPVVCVSIAIIIVVCYVVWMAKRKYFPPIVFLIGERKKEYERIVKIKSKIFWGVIVTAFVTVGVTLLCKYVFRI